LTASSLLFAHVTRRPDDQIDLALAALLIGEVEQADLDVGSWMAEIDALAQSAAERAGEGASVEARLGAVVDLLFGELGFRGNDRDYYDPRNSCLHEVLTRRVGIPISLSVLFLAVAERVGLEVVGLAFPGHFMVLWRGPKGDVILDPFFGGTRVEKEELAERLARISGAKVDIAEKLPVATRRQILTRMLNNLRGIYQRRNDPARGKFIAERLEILGHVGEAVGGDVN
jgi:regulator of sirC expression with transglutaminase-like and TPR domain